MCHDIQNQFEDVFKGNISLIPKAHNFLNALFTTLSPQSKIIALKYIFADFKQKKYAISHLNSMMPKFKTIKCDYDTIHTELLRMNMLNASRENLFNDTILFATHEEPTDNQYHHNSDFMPFSQHTNCCHQISVINLLKYYVENYSETKQPQFSFDLSALKNYNKNKNDDIKSLNTFSISKDNDIKSLDTFSLNRDDEIETLDTISVNRDDFTIESRFDVHKNIQDKFNCVAESVSANNKFLLQHHCNLSKADKNQN